MRIRHAVAAAGACAAALFSLTGCTVPTAGATGIAVTEDGKPFGMLMVCHGHIDGATLYTETTGDESETVARWSHARPLTEFVTWPLATGGDGWSVGHPMPKALEQRRSYTLYGWTEDSSWSTGDVSFTLADLAKLSPGQVRYFAGDVRGADRDGYRTASFEEFRTDACKDV
ncbi:hypothetical protein [Streptomyces sp. HUAS ZL42]|uniref:hypothetical protein n=1 Tax=Streptomyces sp. HUAS ZL42 TaxID=3231715 RepID=UPI00345E5BD0